MDFTTEPRYQAVGQKPHERFFIIHIGRLGAKKLPEGEGPSYRKTGEGKGLTSELKNRTPSRGVRGGGAVEPKTAAKHWRLGAWEGHVLWAKKQSEKRTAGHR